jgi:hypothetical protein
MYCFDQCNAHLYVIVFTTRKISRRRLPYENMEVCSRPICGPLQLGLV